MKNLSQMIFIVVTFEEGEWGFPSKRGTSVYASRSQVRAANRAQLIASESGLSAMQVGVIGVDIRGLANTSGVVRLDQLRPWIHGSKKKDSGPTEAKRN